MQRRLSIIFLWLCCTCSLSQARSFNQQKTDSLLHENLQGYDLQALYNYTPDMFVLGFIGNDFERFRIHFLSFKKDSTQPNQYLISGKDKVKENVCAFSGYLHIDSIKPRALSAFAAHDTAYPTVPFRIYGHYEFKEDAANSHSGILSGTCYIDAYFDLLYQVQYDERVLATDMFCNNQFSGTWKSYDGKNVMTCNWGDYRIPNAGKLDIGVGEFNPDVKYNAHGWGDYVREFKDADDMERYKNDPKRVWW